MEIQGGARRQCFGAFNFCRRKLWRTASVKDCLSGEARRTNEQGRRSQSKKVTELAPRNLCFLFTIIRKVVLVGRSGGPDVAFVRDVICHYTLDRFRKII